jgi:hypothetical protein
MYAWHDAGSRDVFMFMLVSDQPVPRSYDELAFKSFQARRKNVLELSIYWLDQLDGTRFALSFDDPYNTWLLVAEGKGTCFGKDARDIAYPLLKRVAEQWLKHC